MATEPWSLYARSLDEMSSTRSSPSSSSSSSGSSGETPPVTPKTSKICGVCGDVARCYHFGGLCCASCKAFFRRAVVNDRYKQVREYRGE